MADRGSGDMVAARLVLPRVYPITPAKPDAHELLGWLGELLDCGCTFFQFRRKGRTDAEQLKELDAVLKASLPFGARVIVDDRCDLCMLAGAAGVHLGQTDLPPAEARALLGPAAILGFSTHDPLQAEAGFVEPVNYLALGPVFPTGSKTDPDPVVTPQVQAEVLRSCPVPLVAIGGITPERAPELWARGFASVALISAFETEPRKAWEAFAKSSEG